MARIIHLHGSEHDEAQRLLPWYVSGALDAVEFAAVDSHLADCAECRADAAWERRMMAEVETLPMLAGELSEQGARLPVMRSAPRRPVWAPLADLWHAVMRPIGLGWALAAQVAIVAAAFAVVPFLSRPVTYRALSAPQPAAVGNIIVIFRPDAKEQDLRRILTLAGARLVDGPTPADAYVLRVSPAHRPAALARLQAQRDVVLAQPIDPAPPS
jgi:hypothetical protein